jgi:DNA-binding NarL/FixJ family response regulator
VAAYILKEADFNQLAEILRKVHEGENYFNPLISALAFRMVANLLQKETKSSRRELQKKLDLPIPGLSKTEMKILASIGEGRSDKEIADRLKLKAGTVRNYISRAMRKAGLKNRTQAAVYAIKNGLSDSS